MESLQVGDAFTGYIGHLSLGWRQMRHSFGVGVVDCLVRGILPRQRSQVDA